MPKYWSFLQTGKLESRAAASVTVLSLKHAPSWSGNWTEKALQELLGPHLGSNPFLRAAVLIRVATARMASLQNIPCRRWLAVLPSGHQLPTLLTRGSKAPTKAITQA